jgi:RNA recognition motif-containing protein
MHHKRLYVGDLSENVTQEQLHTLFEQAGEVQSVDLISKLPQPAFAFVEMASVEEARTAITKYNGYDLAGQRLIVYAVPPRSHRHVNNA